MSQEFDFAGDFQATDFEIDEIISHAKSAWDMHKLEHSSPEEENIYASFITVYSMNYVMGKHASALEAKLDEVIEALREIGKASG